MKRILLTFDVEEFDFPRLAGNPIKKGYEFELSRKGLLLILDLLGKYNIKATFFVTAEFAKRYPKLIKEMSREGQEIACHGHTHKDNYINGLSKLNLAKKEIERVITVKVNGFRAPRFEINTRDISRLSDFGFIYDSSIHPTWIPKRYMNLFKKKGVYKIGNTIEISPSVLPFLRLPIFWLAFKNLGINYSKLFTKVNFIFSDYCMLLLHPWEFVNLKDIKIPKYVKRKYGKELLNLLERYILFARSNNYQFNTISSYLQKSLR